MHPHHISQRSLLPSEGLLGGAIKEARDPPVALFLLGLIQDRPLRAGRERSRSTTRSNICPPTPEGPTSAGCHQMSLPHQYSDQPVDVSSCKKEDPSSGFTVEATPEAVRKTSHLPGCWWESQSPIFSPHSCHGITGTLYIRHIHPMNTFLNLAEHSA